MFTGEGKADKLRTFNKVRFEGAAATTDEIQEALQT